jgi:acetoin utilization deacetylase AcuC-like enzyme
MNTNTNVETNIASTIECKAFHYSNYSIPLPEHSRYRLQRFTLLCDLVRQDPDLKHLSLYEGSPVSEELLQSTHSKEYISLIREGYGPDIARTIRFDWSPALFTRTSASVGCAILASEAAAESGVGIVLGGGAHHAFYGHGAGFCVFNDIVIAAKYALEKKYARKVGILDCDVHQGDGTASLCQDEERIITCSIHGKNNYPFVKVNSDLDIELIDDCGAEAYLSGVQSGLQYLLETEECDWLIYIGGADPYELDSFGRLKIPADALRQRDALVKRSCALKEIPIVLLFGGGYAPNVADTVAVQLETVRQIAASL